MFNPELEEKKPDLTVDLLDRISNKAKALKLMIISDRVKEQDMQSSVFNSVTQIFQIIREDMTEMDFNLAVTYS